MESASISICNQKGGVGKSSLTVLLASYLHYTLGHDVLVMDCDYPQWSVHAQRERELSVLENSKYYKLMLIRQFKARAVNLWPCPSLALRPKRRSGNPVSPGTAVTYLRLFSTIFRVRSIRRVSSRYSRLWIVFSFP